ncbi:hypothetical protein MC885_011456 [Smutsia gigantea]|nr:hypothetical protein MC885_011456 [Smutsia gigantea]
MATETRVSRWYFGGLASCGAACCTHPLDLLKVHLQTQQEVKLRMTGLALQVVRSDGILALYNGLSASLCRQMTYSLTRFAIYETVRDQVTKDSQGPLPFYKKVLLGSISGCIGGFVGTPADMVNVRMQNDVKLPQNQRRKRALLQELVVRDSLTCTRSVSPGSYAHALDGLYRVAREEGLKKLFSGASMASSRGLLVTVGQLSCYDQAKQLVLGTGCLSDGIFTHLVASFIAGGCATFLCQPLDVLKTRLMNSKGEYQLWSWPRPGAPPGPLGLPHQQPGRPLALCMCPASCGCLGPFQPSLHTHPICGATTGPGRACSGLCLSLRRAALLSVLPFLQGVLHCAMDTARLGPLAFYKGLLPAGIRLVPHTVLTFVFLEQLRKHFGIKVSP